MTRMRSGDRVQARILVVDDERTIALTLSTVLQTQGYEVATALSGKDAVAKAADFSPDLLVSETDTDAMNGVEAAARITAMLPARRLLLLYDRSSMNEIMSIAASERLVCIFMPKPVYLPDFLSVIVRMLPVRSTTDDKAAMAEKRGALLRFAYGMKPLAGRINLNQVGI